MEGTSYPYAVGVVRSKEDSLLSPAMWQRLESAPYAEAEAELAGSGYGGGERGSEAMIARELAGTRELLLDIAPEPALLTALFVQTDAHNLKVLFKGRLVQSGASSLLQEGGTLDTELLAACVNAGEYDRLPPPLAERLASVEASLTPHTDPAALSSALDDAAYAYALRSLSGHKGAPFRRVILQKIELTNLITLLRARALNWDADALSPLLLTCGPTPAGEWLRRYRLPPEEMRSSLGSPLETAVADAAREDIGKAEQTAREGIDRMLRADKDDPFGVGPLLWYFTAKQDEARRLRLLFARKRADKEGTS